MFNYWRLHHFNVFLCITNLQYILNVFIHLTQILTLTYTE